MTELEIFSSNVIKTNKLGNLNIKTTIVFYDYPRCFICENNSKFYALLEMDTNDDGFGWNTCEVSLEDINKVNLGLNNVQSLFKNKKSYIIYFSRNDLIGDVKKVESFEGDNAIEGDLIVEGFCDMDEVFDYHNLQENARSNNFASISFILENSDSCKTGDFLNIIKYMRSFCSKLKSPLDLNNSFVNFQRGSSVVTFEFKKPNDLFDNDEEFKYADINNFANFLLADNPEEMFAEAKDKVCIKKFDRFLEETSKQDSLKPKLVIAMPNKPRVMAFNVGKKEQMPKNEIAKKTIDLFESKGYTEEEIVSRNGKLNGFLIGDKNKFIFKTQNDEIIRGSIDFSMISNNREFSINGSLYKAEFKITKIFYGKKEEKRIYKLIKLDEIAKKTAIETIDLLWLKNTYD